MADGLYLIKGETLTGIGDAIRQVTGKTSAIKVENYASELIENIPIYYTVGFYEIGNPTPLAFYKAVEDGSGVIYTGATPESSGTYYFNGWNKDTSSVTGNMMVYANTLTSQQVINTLTYEIYPTYYIDGSISGSVFDIIGCTNQEFVIIPNIINGAEPRELKLGAVGSNLKAITVPPFIHIDPDVFRDCTNLQDVYFLGNKRQWYNTMQNNFGLDLENVNRQEYNSNFWLAPRIHTTDGCIINQF